MNADSTPFDVIVVGGGMIGSSAARHLSAGGHNVAVIAAPEPPDWASGIGPYASHYDAGRITRVISSDPVWAELAARSIGRYGEIEAASGITFHDPRGLAWMGIGIDQAIETAVERGSTARLVDPEWLESTTGIRMPAIDGMQSAIEPAPAGVVNPRQLVAAQLHLAAAAGATVISSPATSIDRSSANGELTVSGPNGSLSCSKVLLATGAYGGELMGVDLGLERLLRTTVRIDMGPAPEMPSAIADPVPHDHIGHMYWNPPVKYPDGRMLFKIGCEVPDAPQAHTSDEINRWFTTKGDPQEAAALLATAREFLPHADMRSFETVPCVITQTASGYPTIDWIDDDIAVALGGNGSSAKSCDEIGRLAAQLVSGAEWVDPDIDLHLFAAPGRS